MFILELLVAFEVEQTSKFKEMLTDLCKQSQEDKNKENHGK